LPIPINVANKYNALAISYKTVRERIRLSSKTTMTKEDRLRVMKNFFDSFIDDFVEANVQDLVHEDQVADDNGEVERRLSQDAEEMITQYRNYHVQHAVSEAMFANDDKNFIAQKSFDDRNIRLESNKTRAARDGGDVFAAQAALDQSRNAGVTGADHQQARDLFNSFMDNERELSVGDAQAQYDDTGISDAQKQAARGICKWLYRNSEDRSKGKRNTIKMGSTSHLELADSIVSRPLREQLLIFYIIENDIKKQPTNEQIIASQYHIPDETVFNDKMTRSGLRFIRTFFMGDYVKWKNISKAAQYASQARDVLNENFSANVNMTSDEAVAKLHEKGLPEEYDGNWDEYAFQGDDQAALMQSLMDDRRVIMALSQDPNRAAELHIALGVLHKDIEAIGRVITKKIRNKTNHGDNADAVDSAFDKILGTLDTLNSVLSAATEGTHTFANTGGSITPYSYSVGGAFQVLGIISAVCQIVSLGSAYSVLNKAEVASSISNIIGTLLGMGSGAMVGIDSGSDIIKGVSASEGLLKATEVSTIGMIGAGLGIASGLASTIAGGINLGKAKSNENKGNESDADREAISDAAIGQKRILTNIALYSKLNSQISKEGARLDIATGAMSMIGSALFLCGFAPFGAAVSAIGGLVTLAGKIAQYCKKKEARKLIINRYFRLDLAKAKMTGTDEEKEGMVDKLRAMCEQRMGIENDEMMDQHISMKYAKYLYKLVFMKNAGPHRYTQAQDIANDRAAIDADNQVIAGIQNGPQMAEADRNGALERLAACNLIRSFGVKTRFSVDGDARPGTTQDELEAKIHL